MNSIRWMSLVIVLVAIDQLSKWWTEMALPLHSQIRLLPFLSFFRTYNEGIAFSFLSDLGRWPLVVMTIAIILFVLWLWRGLEAGRNLAGLGYALVIAGAIGNLIDRLWLGKVIDMIFFHIDSLEFQFAIFNVADTFITIGAIAIILDEFLVWKASGKQEIPQTGPSENTTGKTGK